MFEAKAMIATVRCVEDQFVVVVVSELSEGIARQAYQLQCAAQLGFLGFLPIVIQPPPTVGHNDQMAIIIYRASSKPKIEIAPTTNRRTVVYNFS
jgi:hypothetical protein